MAEPVQQRAQEIAMLSISYILTKSGVNKDNVADRMLADGEITTDEHAWYCDVLERARLEREAREAAGA